MKKEKMVRRRRSRKTFRLKTLVMSLLLCVTLFSVIGGSLAWLMDTTEPVTNVFTYGDINITLTETTGEEYKMTPGKVLDKDPVVTVLADSEDCWLFVKIDESADKALDDYIEYKVDEGWTPLKDADNNDVTGVYYRSVSNNAADQKFYVLKDNKVSVLETVTKEMLEALNEQNYPTLTFTAYAVQRDANIAAIDTEYEAWTLVSAGN